LKSGLKEVGELVKHHRRGLKIDATGDPNLLVPSCPPPLTRTDSK
jgi:hypothetical protein